MKRVLAMLIAVLMLTAILTACGHSENPSHRASTDDKLSIVATIFTPYDFSRQIAGDKADITMLLPPASESHSFEPTPQDIIKIQNCDVFIYVGGESDEWVNEVLESMDTSEMKIITLMDCVEVVEEEIVEGMEEEEHADESDDREEGPEYDEHVWTSPRNAKLIVQKLSDAFCEDDTANADIYKTNAASYIAKLEELDAKFQAVVDNAVRKTLVFGDRFPFRYFVDAYGLDYFAAFPGCSTETEPSAATIAFLIDKVNAENIPVVFHIELSNEKMANTIAEAAGAKVLELHAAHNISKADFEAGKTYLDIMTANVDTLKEALN
ncbi:hypothetical protein FACS189499_09490 [Clostridia bacterium]|nr:hypothetical protein FACS189499_09490 [Clostridia bacterium]